MFGRFRAPRPTAPGVPAVVVETVRKMGELYADRPGSEKPLKDPGTVFRRQSGTSQISPSTRMRLLAGMTSC